MPIVVDLLIKRGADVNKTNRHEESPLLVATQFSNLIEINFSLSIEKCHKISTENSNFFYFCQIIMILSICSLKMEPM